jgi:hypothetical protein
LPFYAALPLLFFAFLPPFSGGEGSNTFFFADILITSSQLCTIQPLSRVVLCPGRRFTALFVCHFA